MLNSNIYENIARSSYCGVWLLIIAYWNTLSSTNTYGLKDQVYRKDLTFINAFQFLIFSFIIRLIRNCLNLQLDISEHHQISRIAFTRSFIPISLNYKINRNDICIVDQVKDIDVIFDSKLILIFTLTMILIISMVFQKNMQKF